MTGRLIARRRAVSLTAVNPQNPWNRLLRRQVDLTVQTLDHVRHTERRGRTRPLWVRRGAFAPGSGCAAASPQPHTKEHHTQEQQQFHTLVRPSKTSSTKREPT